jgi:hypothetical protein
MRAIRFFLLSVLFLFVLLTGIGLFLPRQVTVSRAVDIQASRATIHTLLSDPNRWKFWFPGADSLPLVIKEGRAIGINTPNGNLLSIRSITDTTVEIQGLQSAAVDGNMGFRLVGQALEGPVTVQWYMNFQFDWYPWERFSSLLLENKFGLIMEQGLKQLQQQAQSGTDIN